MSGWRKVVPADAGNGASGDGQAAEQPRVRTCLRCSGPFNSTWAGERICPHCKGSGAWRNGLPLPSRPVPGRRS